MAKLPLKTAEKEINDKTVKIVLVGAIDGIKITTKLSKLIFPAIAALKEGKEDSMDNLVNSLLDSVEEIDLESIIKKLFANATVDDFPLDPDKYFAGNYGELVDYLAFALEENFGSFFDSEFLKGQDIPTFQK